MNKKVYISGAIAYHDIDERRAVFAAAARKLRSEVTADLQTEDGETRLIIKRNGRLLQVYYIQK